MTGYFQARRAEVERAMLEQIDRFVACYDPKRETVLVVPGTTGSQLDRSSRPFSGRLDRLGGYDPVWLDTGALWGDIARLEIDAERRDVGDYIIVPNGPIALYVSPYDYTEKYFARHGFNYVLFSYDWRRPLDEAAAQLDFFVEQLADRIAARHRGECDPRAQLTVACHSMGGLVALLYLQRLRRRALDFGADLSRCLHRIVTVGTPFYGTAAPLNYFHFGKPLLNLMCGSRETFVRVVRSFPGLAVLHFLDRATYKAYRDAYASRGEAPELARYPWRDAAHPDDETFDIYDDRSANHRPSWMDARHLASAHILRREMHVPLPEEILSRLFHIRLARHGTCGEVRWRCEKKDLGETDTPYEQVNGVGDDTVPYWSARYCRTPRERLWDANSDVSHAFLMEDEGVLGAIASLARTGAFPSAIAPPVQPLPPEADGRTPSGFRADAGAGAPKPEYAWGANPGQSPQLFGEIGFD